MQKRFGRLTGRLHQYRPARDVLAVDRRTDFIGFQSRRATIRPAVTLSRRLSRRLSRPQSVDARPRPGGDGSRGGGRRARRFKPRENCAALPDAGANNATIVEMGATAVGAWRGVVLYGMAWYGVIWYGMAWYGMVRRGMVWRGMA